MPEMASSARGVSSRKQRGAAQQAVEFVEDFAGRPRRFGARACGSLHQGFERGGVLAAEFVDERGRVNLVRQLRRDGRPGSGGW